MASVKSVLDDLFTVKELSKICRRGIDETNYKLLLALTPDLCALERTVTDLRIVIFRPQFKSAPYADQVLTKIHELAEQAKSDVQAANDLVTTFLHTRRESGRLRAEKAVSQKELQKSRASIRSFTRHMHSLQDAIEGREDWSRMSPKEPLTPSPVSEGPSSKRNSLTLAPPAAPKVTISAPASPMQPTVEDVEDDPEEGPRNVRNYHYVHPDDAEAEAESSKSKDMAFPSIPPVLVRAPTDPFTEEDVPKAETKETAKYPLKSAMKKPSPPTSNTNTPRSESKYTSVPGAPRIETRTLTGRALEEAQKKAQQLEAELEELRSPDQSPLPLTTDLPTRTQHTSIDFSSGGLHPQFQPRQPARPRANTATGLERPSVHRTDPEPDRRITPKQSPREQSRGYAEGTDRLRASPRYSARHYQPSPRMSQPTLGQDTFDDPSRYQSARHYAADGRTSLPAVLEQDRHNLHNSTNRPGVGQMRYSPRGHHLDGEYNDFFRHDDGKAGDFSLFDDATEPTEVPRDTRASPRASPGSSPSSREAWRPVIEHDLHIALEELFTGVERTANINRRVYGTEEDIQVRIPIYPGLKPGSKIKFAGKGDITERGKQDIHFVVRQAPHPIFEWRDRDLYATIELPVAAALLGWEKNIRTVCGKTVRVSHPGPTPPGWKECYAGLGMCSRRDPNIRGDMIVGVNVVWPRPGSLNDRQKELIRQALMPSTPRSERAGGAGVY